MFLAFWLALTSRSPACLAPAGWLGPVGCDRPRPVARLVPLVSHTNTLLGRELGECEALWFDWMHKITLLKAHEGTDTMSYGPARMPLSVFGRLCVQKLLGRQQTVKNYYCSLGMCQGDSDRNATRVSDYALPFMVLLVFLRVYGKTTGL